MISAEDGLLHHRSQAAMGPPQTTAKSVLLAWMEWFQFPIKSFTALTIPDVSREDAEHLYPWAFVMSMAWLALFAYLVVAACNGIHKDFRISTSVLGYTVAAAGTSFPNVFSGMCVARQGKTTMAVANALGANVQNVFLALAIPWAIQCTLNRGSFELPFTGLLSAVVEIYVTLLPVVVDLCLLFGRGTDSRHLALPILALFLFSHSSMTWSLVVQCHLFLNGTFVVQYFGSGFQPFRCLGAAVMVTAPGGDQSRRRYAVGVSFISLIGLLLAYLAVFFRSEPEPEYTYASFKRHEEGPLPEVPKEIWDEARSQLRVRLREIEEHRERAAERRRLEKEEKENEEEKEMERRLWAEAVEEVEAEPRELFNLFKLLNSNAGTESEEQQMAEQEAHALQEHHETHKNVNGKPDPDSLLGKLMKNNVDKGAGKVNPNQNRPEQFDEDTEAKKVAMAELLKKGGHGNGEDLKQQFEELQAQAKKKANQAKKVFEEKLAAEKKKLAEKQKAAKERLEHELKSKQLKDQIQIMKEQQEEARVQEDSIQKGISLYCWALMMPFGYEAGLLLEQKRQGVGIFECDEWAVYSNQSMMADGSPFPFPVHEVTGPNGEPISLFVPLGGRWHTALNRDVFNQVWLKVVEVDHYRKHDWIVKVDPDSVFFPKRLKQVIGRRVPLKDVKMQGPEPDELDCTYCKKKGFTKQSCASHVHWLQSQGHTCRDALTSVARDPPVDCGCKCNDFACDLPADQVHHQCCWTAKESGNHGLVLRPQFPQLLCSPGASKWHTPPRD
eukprot:s784_g12.t1